MTDLGVYQLRCEIAFTSPFVAPSFTDVTSRLIGFDSAVGNQYDYDGPQPGTLSVRLDNTDGALSPENSSSPYAGSILPNRIVRIRAERINGSGLVTLCSGYVDSWERSFPGGMALSETVVTCTDLTKYFARWTSASTVVQNTAAFHMNALTGATTPGGGGLTIAATTYTGNQWDNVTNLAAADGGLFFIAPDNIATYQSSDYRKSASRSTTVQETFVFGLPAGTEIVGEDLRLLLDDRLLANIINVTDAAGTVHTATSGTSRAEYGDLSFDLSATRLISAAADTRAADIRTQRALPGPRIEQFTIDALTGDQQRLDAFELRIGDRVRFTHQGLRGGAVSNRDYWIRSIAHSVSYDPPQWLTTYQVVACY